MFNIINLKAREYLRTNVEMVYHKFSTRGSNLACVIPVLKIFTYELLYYYVYLFMYLFLYFLKFILSGRPHWKQMCYYVL